MTALLHTDEHRPIAMAAADGERPEPAQLSDGLLTRAYLLGNPLIRRLTKLNMNSHDFVIFGSGPLLACGIRSHISDLDVVARGSAWRRASAVGEPVKSPITGDSTVQFFGGRIQFSQRWISEHWDTNDLIDRATVIGGLRFAPLIDVLAYKQMLGRAKDLADIKALLAHPDSES